MIKFIIPVAILFLIILFWDKISQVIYKNFNIKINNFIILILLLILGIIFVLLYY
jgi:hypothetical protein